MRSRPSSSATLMLAICAGGLIAAGSAQAQVTSPLASNPRYMSWANRPASTTPADVALAQSRARTGLIPRRVAPSQALARPAMQPFNPPVPISDGGLTPASAWIGPRVTPAYAPGAPNAVAYAAAELTPVPGPPVREAAPTPARVAEPAPTRVAAPALSPVVAPPPPPPPPPSREVAAAPVAEAAADPMAPRRDAPIFRIGANSQPAAMPTGSTETAPQAQNQAAPAQGQQARYYSVHRAAGRQPDATVMPEPVFFDSVALDLAEPPPVEPPLRDAQGRRRLVANDDPSLP